MGELECEWKADGVEIEFSSDAVGHLIFYLEYIVSAEDLGFDKRDYYGLYSHCGMQMFGCLDMGKFCKILI